ncbi:MAG: molybdopterin-dependent oxidoreductase [Solirubrobacteraceae bacterium]
MPITPRIWAERGRRRALRLGIDPERLPPGQSPTTKFPVLTVGRTPRVAPEDWALEVRGEAQAPFVLGWDELMALEQVDQSSDLHCVTRWSQFDMPWRGVRVRGLIERARPTARATHAMVHAHGDYTTNLPLEALLDDHVLIAHALDGAPLAREHGSPARLLVPRRYLWKSAKWVRGIELMSGDRPGLWERNGYHNDGDPFSEERHAADPRAVRDRRRDLRGG